MATTIAVQMTPRGLLIPQAALQEWHQTELEAIKDQTGILIRPKTARQAAPARGLQKEWTWLVQSLRTAGVTSPLAEPLLSPAAPVSPARRAELACYLAVGQPLSEIVIAERAERW